MALRNFDNFISVSLQIFGGYLHTTQEKHPAAASARADWVMGRHSVVLSCSGKKGGYTHRTLLSLLPVWLVGG